MYSPPKNENNWVEILEEAGVNPLEGGGCVEEGEWIRGEWGEREGEECWGRELKGRLRPRGKEYREFPPSWQALRCAGPDKCQHASLLLRLPSPSTPASASVSLCMFLKCQPCLCRFFCTLLSLLFAAVPVRGSVCVGVGRNFSYFPPSPRFVMSCFTGVHQKIMFFSLPFYVAFN